MTEQTKRHLVRLLMHTNQGQTDTNFFTDTRYRYFFTAPIPMPIPIPRGTLVWRDTCSQAFFMKVTKHIFIGRTGHVNASNKYTAQRNSQNSYIQRCRLKLLISKIVLYQQEHFSTLKRKSIATVCTVTVKVASKAEQACETQVVYSIGIGPLFHRCPYLADTRYWYRSNPSGITVVLGDIGIQDNKGKLFFR